MSQEPFPGGGPAAPADPVAPPPRPDSAAGGAAVASLQASWAGLGQPERFTVVAAAVVAVSYLLGVLVEGWSLSTSAAVLIVGSLVVIGAVFARASRSSSSGPLAVAIRGGAALVGAFALVDLGDLLGNLDETGDFSTLTLLLWVAYVVAGIALVWTAWRATGGDALADATALASTARPLQTRLVYAGAAAAALGWAIVLVGDVVNMLSDSDIALACAVLAAVALWAATAGLIRAWPIAPAYVVATFAGVTAVIGLIWLVRILPDLGKAGAIGVVGILVYVVGVAVLVVGGALPARDELARQRA